VFELTVLDNPWMPERVKEGITLRQAEFLSYEGREALFGGAAGGGKSVAILLAALQYAEEPGYTALILRRTHKQLAKADSILSKAKEWLLPLGVRWNGDEHKFTFPSGATLEFGHMAEANAIYDYQGGSWAFVGVDEATQFTEEMIAYPRTRQRRVAGSAVPIRWRGASNPGGIGHEHIKARYVADESGRSPCTPQRQFFPATLQDNPHIDREDYVQQLREGGIDPLTLQQLLNGDWDAVAGGRFQKSWFRRYDLAHDGTEVVLEGRRPVMLRDCARFATVDVAASVKDSADYTVISSWAITPCRSLVWLDMDRGRWEVPDLVPAVRRSYRRWALDYVGVEGGGTQKAVYQLLCRTDMAARELLPGQADKLMRATAAIVLAEAGRVYVPRGGADAPWLADALGELVRFTGDPGRDAHDDVVDTVAYAARMLRNLDDRGKGFAPKVIGQRSQPAPGRPAPRLISPLGHLGRG
jgi:predicted phage terminase large subunit-like protein